MKKLFAATIVLAGLLSGPAFADPVCGHYMPNGCDPYGPGLTELLQLDPLEYDDGDAWFASGFDEDEADSLGLYDIVSYDGSTPDVVVASGPNPLTVKAIQELNAIVEAQAILIADLESRVTALETP